MARSRVMCPHCHDFHTLELDEKDPEPFVEVWYCLECEKRYTVYRATDGGLPGYAVKDLTPEELKALKARGGKESKFNSKTGTKQRLPELPEEDRAPIPDAPMFTLDDVIDFHLLLSDEKELESWLS